jgi:hypothetical protein
VTSLSLPLRPDRQGVDPAAFCVTRGPRRAKQETSGGEMRPSVIGNATLEVTMGVGSRGLALAAVLWSGAATAGEQYVDASGYAASGFDVTAYFGENPGPTPGRATITAEWNGAVWAFASEENRARFLADPEAFAPAYDGHCAYGVAKGGKFPGDPNHWRVVDGVLYLNLQRSVQATWLKDVPRYIDAAEANWPELDLEPASDRPAPELAAGLAPAPG